MHNYILEYTPDKNNIFESGPMLKQISVSWGPYEEITLRPELNITGFGKTISRNLVEGTGIDNLDVVVVVLTLKLES